MTHFRIRGVDPTPFSNLFGQSDEKLRASGIFRYKAEEGSRHPDRVELRHALPGENVLLVNYVHQPANTPYRASHAIYVLEGATQAADLIDVIPEPLQVRLLSLRAFDSDHMIADAAITEGTNADAIVRKLLKNPDISYIQAHYAARGCYAARIERA